MKTRGFTLIELIIVVAIIGLLAAATFVAIDPAKRIGEANDAQRWSDVTAILNAVLTYTADVNTLPSNITALANNDQYYMVDNGTTATPTGGCAATGVDLKTQLVGDYLATIPNDPGGGTNSGTTTTGYWIMKSSANRITVGACSNSYSGSTIQVQR